VRLAIQRPRAAEAEGTPIVISADRVAELFELWIRESVSKKRPKTAASYQSEARAWSELRSTASRSRWVLFQTIAPHRRAIWGGREPAVVRAG
jgi:hypothetical protein